MAGGEVMSYIFEETGVNYGGSEAVPIGDRPLDRILTIKDAVPGYIVQHLQEFDGGPPFTAAQKAYGSLWYGNQRPDIILSSEAMMKRMIKRLIPSQHKPVMYGKNFGFMFNSAKWSHPDGLGFEIEDGWVFMLNTGNPTDIKLNGCYRPMDGA